MLRRLALLPLIAILSACCLDVSATGGSGTTTGAAVVGTSSAAGASSNSNGAGPATATGASSSAASTGTSSGGAGGGFSTGTTGGDVDAGPWAVTTLVGGEPWGAQDGTDGPDGTAQFAALHGIAVDSSGSIYLTGENGIRKIDLQGNVTTLVKASPNGPLIDPWGIALDSMGDILVTDYTGNNVQKLDSKGVLSTVAGNGTQGFSDGTGGASGTAQFDSPAGLAVNQQGNIFVADEGNNRIREIDTSGNVTTVAGNGKLGSADGTGGASGTAEFAAPYGLAIDADGNIFTADFIGYRVRKIDTLGNVTTLAGNGNQGYADGSGGRAGTAEFVAPAGLAFDGQGYLLVADDWGDRIRRISPSGEVTTFAGNGMEGTMDGLTGSGGTAELYDPTGLAVDLSGNVYDVEGDTPGRVRVFRHP